MKLICRCSTLFFSSINPFFENGWVDWEENERERAVRPKETVQSNNSRIVCCCFIGGWASHSLFFSSFVFLNFMKTKREKKEKNERSEPGLVGLLVSLWGYGRGEARTAPQRKKTSRSKPTQPTIFSSSTPFNLSSTKEQTMKFNHKWN